MQYHTDDVRITGMAEVRPPAELIEELPVRPQQSVWCSTCAAKPATSSPGVTAACS